MISMLESVAQEKARMREEMKARRAFIDEAGRARAAWRLGERVLDWLDTRPERTIGVYLARPWELSLDFLAQTLIRDGLIVAAPRVNLESQTMNFHRLRDVEQVEIGPYRVREPFVDEAVVPEIVFVPGLAFDARGGRLGTGGGWYDRFLSGDSVKVGVCFECLVVDEVPVEEHDARMDFVMSDARWIEV